MMDAKVLDKERVPELLGGLIEHYRVIAPVRTEGVVLFEAIATGDDALLDYTNTRLPVKEVFLPRTEVMFVFDDNQVDEAPAAAPDAERAETVVYGVRPCDAASLPLLDAVYDAADYRDIYYTRRRASTYLIGVACNRPLSTCFCGSVGGGPFGHRGLDVLLCDLGSRYLVEPVSDRGAALLEGNPLLQGATEADLSEREHLARTAEQRLASAVTIQGLKERLEGMYDDPFWDALHQKCLGCGVCTYLCPTCHCFDILDETNGRRGRRVRIWDSCQFPLFTLHASGHNPRPSGKERMRQRVMHKFRYFVENYGEPACVGCGRCIRHCPANMDIRQVLDTVMAFPQGAEG